MNVKRTLKIQYRIIKAEDLKKLIEVLREKADGKMSIEIRCTHDKRFTFKIDDDYSEVYKIFDREKIYEIKIFAYDNEKEIFVRIIQDNYSESYLEVKGDEDWVNSVFKALEDIVEKWQKLPTKFINNLLSINNIPITIIIIILLVLVFIIPLYNFIMLFNISAEKGKDITLIVAVFLFFLVSFYFPSVVEKLFPVIEIQTGPEHLHYEKIRRNRMLAFFSFFLFPLFLNLIFWIFR